MNTITHFLKNITRHFAFLIFLFSYFINAQTTQTFTSSGTFTVPAGVTSISVEAWGAGGSGGYLTSNGETGGGGGGAYAKKVLTVIPGNSYIYIVGAGAGNTSSSPGGDSWFNSITTVLAKGGNSVALNSTNGATGGAGASSIGDVVFSGGNGSNASSNGGGGGSSAGSTAIGTNATSRIGAVAPINGGNGGDGSPNKTTNASPGSIPGGGGGGTERQGTGSSSGNGGSGQIKISWIQPTLLVTPTTINFSYVISGGTSSVASFSLSGTNLTGAPGTITVNAPVNFEVSLTSGSGFGASVNVPYSSSTLVSTPIYVRFKPTASNTDYSGNITNSGGGATVNVGVSGTSKLTYCTSVGNTNYQTSITNVQFNAINNASAKPAGYSNYTAQSTNVNINSSYNLSVNVNTGGTGTTYTIAWVDWNQDGDFLDVGELFNLGTATTTTNGLTSLSPLNITIPAGASIGNTRMRVATKYNASPISCELATFDGEVEDYTINILLPCTTPATPSVISGTTTLCPLLVGQNYSIAAVTNATTYSWTVPIGWVITSGAGTNSIIVTTGNEGQNGNITVRAGNECGTSTAQTLAVFVNSCTNKWKGNVSNDWNTSSNWTLNFVPVVDANILFDDAPLNHLVLDQERSVTDITNNQSTYRMVLNGKKLTLKGTTYFTNDATIDASSTNAQIEFAGTSLQTLLTTHFYNSEIYNLTVNNSNNIRLNGNLRLLNALTLLSGKFDAFTNSPTITYAGSTLQSILSNQFLADQVYNLTIDNAVGVNLNCNFNITNTLLINAGKKLTVNSQNQLTALGNIINNAGNIGLELKSDTNGTASLLHNSNNVPATVQRYISRNAEDWHFLSSPVSNQLITGTWLPSGTYGNGTGYDLYVWNEPTFCWIYKSDVTSAVNWNTVHPSSNFETARGYLYSVQATKPTKTFEGILNNGSLNYPLTKSTTTDLILKELEGFNLIGNPYPSSIDWSATTGWLRNNLTLSAGGYDMWVWNPGTNNYGVYNSSTQIGTNDITRYLAPMQAYFVKTFSNGNLSMDNTVRVHTGAGNWFRTTNNSDGLIRIKVQSENGNGADEVLLQFGYPNNQWGASKIFSHVTTAPSLYMNAVKEDYSVQYLTNTIENTSVPLAFKAGNDGNYILNMNFNTSEFDYVMLEDRITKTKHLITANETYRFKANVKDTEKRFILHFTPSDEFSKVLPVKIYTDGVQLFADLSLLNKPSEITVYNILGKLLLKKSLTGASLHAIKINVAPQVLIVRLQNEQGILNRKLFFYSIR